MNEDDASEEFSDDLEVQIYEAILAREKTGDSTNSLCDDPAHLPPSMSRVTC